MEPRDLHLSPTCVISYPCSGRTWLRFMINAFIEERLRIRPTSVFDVEKLVPDMPEWLHLHSDLQERSDWQTLPPVPPERIMDRSVVILLRNIYSVLASSYRVATRLLGLYKGSFIEFLRDPRFGPHRVLRFWTLLWEAYGLEAHRKHAHTGGTYVISYDDLLQMLGPSLWHTLGWIRACRTLSTDQTPEALEERACLRLAMHRGHIESMRALALTPPYRGTILQPANDRRARYSGIVCWGGYGLAARLFGGEAINIVRTAIAEHGLLPTAWGAGPAGSYWHRQLELPLILRQAAASTPAPDPSMT